MSSDHDPSGDRTSLPPAVPASGAACPARSAAASLLVPVLLLGGCGEVPSAPPVPSTPPSALGLSPPPALASARAVDRTRLRPIVTLDDGRRVDMDRLGAELWSGTIVLVPGRTYTLFVVWIETIGERELRLAAFERTVTVEDPSEQIVIEESDYRFDFDLDTDGATNLAEREAGTDPFRPPSDAGEPPAPIDDPSIPSDVAADDPGGDGGDGGGGGDDGDDDPDPRFPTAAEITAEVLVPRIAREDAPTIDGRGVALAADGGYAGEWAAATRLDASGDPLVIDNLMVDGGTDETDGEVRRRWAAAHDGEYLYVLVTVDDDERFRDSDELWHDDSLELYLDGNGSASAIHDDDDVQRSLPMVAPGEPDVGVGEGIVPGFFLSQAPVEIDFRTGPGLGPDGRDVYELRVGLASANIEPGRPFGLELQVNDDDGGGTREGKWGWAHPPRGNEDVDLTFFDPSYMGTALLE